MKTRLTDRLGIAHPVIQAPMAFAAGGALAKAVAMVMNVTKPWLWP